MRTTMERRYSFSLRRSSISCRIDASIAVCGSVCRRGLLVMRLARVAYINVFSVSSQKLAAGETQATIRQRADPPMESIRSFVSLESLYGTCAFAAAPCESQRLFSQRRW